MGHQELERTARALIADGKGILAADETVPTVTKRLNALHIESTADSRRTYREMFFTTPGAAEFISGVILYDETIRQKSASGIPLVEVLAKQGIIPGIKVDTGAKPLAGSPDETVTEGLDGLRDRLKEYYGLGARFAKWRAVIRITERFPTSMCIGVNAQALGRYAALCQEAGLVPIVEPEVLMEGTHTIEQCEDVTGAVLHTVFAALYDQKVSLEQMLLKPNMVISGKTCPKQASVNEVATATMRCLRRHVPADRSGHRIFVRADRVTWLRPDISTPSIRWTYPGRGKSVFPTAARFRTRRCMRGMARRINSRLVNKLFHHRAKCNSAAALGTYTDALEGKGAMVAASVGMTEGHDD